MKNPLHANEIGAVATELKSRIDGLAEQGSPAWHDAESVLDVLLKAEVAKREVRSINYQMKAARFANHRDLVGFDFDDSTVNEALVRSLHRGDFIDDAHNVVLIGGPGTGKTHLATAIGLQANVASTSTCALILDHRIGQRLGARKSRWQTGTDG
jgi:DNA replication protein DnaC